MQRSIWIKICGITLPSDIDLVYAAGADAVGLNFIERSKRRVNVEAARTLSALARGKLECVGVVADLDEPQIRELIDRVGLDRVQLHGNEPDELLRRLGSIAYKAVGVASAADVANAETVPGNPLLVDTKVGGLVGGTGTTFDWGLVQALCRKRDVVVAGGLDPDNAARAVLELAPYGLDVASGVEVAGQPRIKNDKLVRRFVDEVRCAELLQSAVRRG